MRDDMSTNETPDFCPYKGLQPYTEEDSEYFFGRNRDSEIIAANLYAAPLTVLHGASGVGKSSVLMAGVVPRLKEEVRFTSVPRLSDVGEGSVPMANVRPQVKETVRFPIIVFRNWQTGDFISALKEEALRAVVPILGEKTEDALRVIEQRLNQEQAMLREIEKRLEDKSSAQPIADEKLAHNKRAVLNAFNTFKRFLQNEKGFDLKAITFDDLLLKCRLVSGNSVFFIFDQFEEYFLYHPSSNGKGSFDAELARAVNRQDVEANFLLSLREDGLSKLDRFQGRIPNLLGNMLRLEHLNRESAKEAILRPLEKYNREAPNHPGPVEIESALVEKLLDEVQTGKVTLDQTGKGQVSAPASSQARIETPFLQMVLMRLWDAEIEKGSRTLRLSTLNELGGAESIVRSHLDSVMGQLRESDREYPNVAAQLFRFLVTPSGMKIAHTLGDLAALSELPEEKVRPVVEALMSVRILRPIEPPPGQPGGTRYEIFHDVLAPAILNWRDRHVKDQKLIQAEQRAKEERQRADEQSRAARRLRRMVAALAVVVLLALATAAYALAQRRKAIANEQRAEDLYRRGEALERDGVRLKAEGDAAKTEAGEEREKNKIARRENEELLEDVKTRTAEAERAEAKALEAGRKAETERQAKVLETKRSLAELLSAQAQRMSVDGQVRRRVVEDYEQAVSLFGQIGDVERQADTFRVAAEVFLTIAENIRKGNAGELENWDGSEDEITEFQNKAIAYLKQSALLYQRLGRKAARHTQDASILRTQEADILRLIGEIYFVQKNNTEAARYYDQSASLYRDDVDVDSKIRVLEKLADLFRYTDRSKALDYNLKLLRLVKSIEGRYRDEDAGVEDKINKMLLTIGDMYRWLGQNQKALDYYSEALSSSDTDDNDNRRSASMLLGHINYDLGNKTAALDNFLKAAPPLPEVLTKGPGFYRGHDAYALSSVGALYYESGNKRMAIGYFVAAYDIYRVGMSRRKHPPDYIFYHYEAVRVLTTLSKIFSELGEEEKALDYRKREAAVSKQLEALLYKNKDISEPKSVLREVGKWYEAVGDFKRAEEFYRKAEAP
jgi:hypothetical protein